LPFREWKHTSPARSSSLYRLPYPGSQACITCVVHCYRALNQSNNQQTLISFCCVLKRKSGCTAKCCRRDLKVCDNGILIHNSILCFRILSIALYLSRTPSCFYFKQNVSETGFCLHLQVKATQLGPIDTAGSDRR
jgi:hypothetical protein